MSISVIGGTVQFTLLTSLISERDYEIGKVFVWHGMLGDMMLPTKWKKPTKKGTAVDFNQIRTQEEYDKALISLEAQMIVINKLYGTDLKLGA